MRQSYKTLNQLKIIYCAALLVAACSNDSDVVVPEPLAGGLPQTGRITSLHPGDDGDWQAGIAWPNPRFVSPSDGTVTDNLTGLVWLKNLECLIDPLPWADAISVANTLSDTGDSACGLTDGSMAGDWRMPNIRELYSVVYRGDSNIAFPFYVGDGQFWSATTVANDSVSAWFVVEEFIRPRNKVDAYRLWPVRGGLNHSGSNTSTYATRIPQTGQKISYLIGDDGFWQAGLELPLERYRDDGNGTITDTLTGLVWLKNNVCLTEWYQWRDAVDAVNAFSDNNSDYCDLADSSKPGDWRLPNVLELHSVVDYSRAEPALADGHPAFGGADARPGWTSTTFSSDGAFELNLSRGGIDEGDGFDLRYSVWPVRGGI